MSDYTEDPMVGYLRERPSAHKPVDERQAELAGRPGHRA